ncbi:hypothetical protein [Microvirga sp. 2TAF3]|uniref:hypothetical protein n=1 Tax=Microvirga sp. 2TAF3 TaxID=3233014 RepID=UPI003F9C566C
MRLLRILLITINMVLAAAFCLPLGDVRFTEPSRSILKVDSLSLPTLVSWPEQPEFARTLFRARPLQVEADNPSPDIGVDPKVRLLGIILTEGQRVAVVERDGAAIRVEEGAHLNEWQVTMIAPRMIRLTHAEQNRDVLLDPQTDSH